MDARDIATDEAGRFEVDARSRRVHPISTARLMRRDERLRQSSFGAAWRVLDAQLLARRATRPTATG